MANSLRSRVVAMAFCVVALLPSAASSALLDPMSCPLTAASFASGATGWTVNSTARTLTDGFTTYDGWLSPGNETVFTFDLFSLDPGGSITVSPGGAYPVALLSRTNLTIAGTITASASGATAGAGGYDGATVAGNGSGPGRGLGTGDGGSGAGFGGKGGDAFLPGWTLGGPAYGDLKTELEGGSGGGKSTDSPTAGNGGGGGGGLELGASGDVVLTSAAMILAKGAAGANGTGDPGDGGGGGAGGGVLIHGASASMDGTVDVSGGKGGDGAGTSPLGGGGGGGGRIAVFTATASAYTDNGVTYSLGGGIGGSGSGGAGLAGAAGNLQVNPEPSSLILCLSGLALLRWRRGADRGVN